MKEKQYWWSPSKPLQSNIKTRHHYEKKTISAQKVVAILGLQQKKLSTATYAVPFDSAFVVKQPLSLHLNLHRWNEEGN